MASTVLELGRYTSLVTSTATTTYAASGTPLPLATRRAGVFFFNHTIALHRPKNGAMAISANASANAIRIQSPLLDSGHRKGVRRVNRQCNKVQSCISTARQVQNFAPLPLSQLSSARTHFDIPHSGHLSNLRATPSHPPNPPSAHYLSRLTPPVTGESVTSCRAFHLISVSWFAGRSTTHR